MTHTSDQPLNYRLAGVDIEAGDALVDRIRPLAARTMRPGVLAGVGGFAALFELPPHLHQPVLVSGTDGVGTKLRLAFQWQRHDSIGIDLVAMSVNDILVQGAEPLYFLDYFACGKLALDTAAEVLAGIARGCEMAGCALIGGETAEMPDMYPDGEYDLAGFAVGVVEKAKLVNGSTITAGDVVLGLASSGAHSNGYSLIRRILERSGATAETLLDGRPLADVLMQPTRIYVRSVLAALAAHGPAIRAMAHITGGGLTGNIPRVLPAGVAASLRRSSWQMPELFRWLQSHGRVADDEMLRVFNCGIGMVLVVPADQCDAVSDTLREQGETVHALGEIVERKGDEPAIRIE